jgi:hypothetical protein
MAGKQERASLMALYESLSTARRHSDGQRKTPSARPVASHTSGHAPIAVAQQIDDIEQERKRLENQDYAQNTTLKRRTINLLFRFLALETTAIFVFAFAQATRWPADFHMEEWSFKLLVTATIAQITGMLLVAVRYLFPRSNG